MPRQSNMIEDDSYRQSSQYRLWSFTATQLNEKRIETNELASERVRAAFARARASNAKSNGTTGDANGSSTDAVVDTLTVDEEKRMVQWGCEMILTIKDNLDPRPPSIVAVRLS